VFMCVFSGLKDLSSCSDLTYADIYWIPSVVRLILPFQCSADCSPPGVDSLNFLRQQASAQTAQNLATTLMCDAKHGEWALSLCEDTPTPANLSLALSVAAQCNAQFALTALDLSVDSTSVGSFAMMLLTMRSLRRFELSIKHVPQIV
jgi:hypothetical protein